MQRKSVSLSLVALAALFAGCEWTSTSGSDSWSGSYDAMNFGGTYRISSITTTSDDTESSHQADWATKEESGGTFAQGATAVSGRTSEQNIVPGSVKISCGSYVWLDNGNGGLSFGGGSSSSGGGNDSSYEYSGEDSLGNLTLDQSYSHRISVMKSSGYSIVEGSVSVKIGNKAAFQDNGSGTLVPTGALGSGSINYGNGVVAFTLDSTQWQGQPVTVSYKYKLASGSSVGSQGLSGSGSVQYSSGAWSLAVTPGMPSRGEIRITYSYYVGTKSNTYTGIDTSNFDPKYVTAITVSQTGQNLTMRLNNGIVMSGKFTSVRQTASVSKDTGAGANTYNAQFQVNSGNESKLVGTLYYDYPTHNRMLDGTWTWGKKTFDVHATGPAWTESGTSTAAETTYTTGK